MKLTLKIAIALAVIATATIVYAEVPDVSRWSCSSDTVINIPSYDMKAVTCGQYGENAYVNISGEPVYVHEHRRTYGAKTVYYNALKTNEGNWVEAVNIKDWLWKTNTAENGDIEVSIMDDNDVVAAKRLIPLLKK